MTPGQWIAIWCILLIAAGVQGAVGFGQNLLAAPLLWQVDHDLVPAPLLVAATLINFLLAVRDRSAIDYPLILPAVFARIPGALLGLVVLLLVSPQAVGYAVALVVFAAVIGNFVGPRFTPTRPVMAGAGFLGGFTGTSAGIGGPPVALALAGLSGPAVRGSMGLYFISGSAMTIALFLVAGILDTDGIVTALGMMPAIGVGFWASRFAIPYLDAGRTRQAILVVSALAAMALLIRLSV